MIVFLVGLTLLTAAEEPVVSRTDPAMDLRIDQRLGDSLPMDVLLTDESGVERPLGDYFRDKPVVLALVYYECPMLCNMVLNGLCRTLRATPFDAGNEFDVLTISIDPGETPAMAREKKDYYVENYGRESAEHGWRFLTGTGEATKAIADAAGFHYMYDEKTGEYAHAGGIMVITPEGKLSHYFFGVEYSPRDLRLALVEAGDGKIGGPMETILLLCMTYNPGERQIRRRDSQDDSTRRRHDRTADHGLCRLDAAPRTPNPTCCTTTELIDGPEQLTVSRIRLDVRQGRRRHLLFSGWHQHLLRRRHRVRAGDFQCALSLAKVASSNPNRRFDHPRIALERNPTADRVGDFCLGQQGFLHRRHDSRGGHAVLCDGQAMDVEDPASDGPPRNEHIACSCR